jgi:hypothetical protein
VQSPEWKRVTTRIGRIVLWGEDEVTDSQWMPLIVFLARAKDEPRVFAPMLEHLDFRDFMLMHGVERKPRPFLYVYKHVDSRRDVVVDADGSPYRFLPRGDDGQYRTSEFSRAVWGLDPWFIRGCEATGAVRRARVAA